MDGEPIVDPPPLVMDCATNTAPVPRDITAMSINSNNGSTGSSGGKLSDTDSDNLSNGISVRESFESISSSVLSDSQQTGSQSLRESSECSLDSLNQDLPAHMQLVPFSGKSITEMAKMASKKQKSGKQNDNNDDLRKNVIKNVCTPQAVPMAIKADANYDLDDLVQSLPKLKVTTPARIHDAGKSAFSMFATPPRQSNVGNAEVKDKLSNTSERNPVDIEPIFSVEGEDAPMSPFFGNINKMDDLNMFRNKGDSATKTHASAFCQGNMFDLKSSLDKAGTFLFKAQRSLFADQPGNPLKTGLNDSMFTNVGSPGVVFKEEQFSPNLSFIATSPSNDSDSSFIIPSQNTDCDYLIRRISYDPTLENMASVNSSKSDTSSRVNVPCSIEELKESPEKSPQKRGADGECMDTSASALAYKPMCVNLPRDCEKELNGEIPAPKTCWEDLRKPHTFSPGQLLHAEGSAMVKTHSVSPRKAPFISGHISNPTNDQSYSMADVLGPSPRKAPFISGQISDHINGQSYSMADVLGPSPRKAPRTTTPSVKSPWKPSGRVKYSLTPSSEMITKNKLGTPVRKINFCSDKNTPQSSIPRYMASTLSSQRNGASMEQINLVQQDVTPRKKTKEKLALREGESTPVKSQTGSLPMAPRAKLPVYRRGTPRQKAATRHTNTATSVRGWTEKNYNTTGNANCQGSARHEESILLEEKKAQLRQLQEAKARLAARLKHRSPVAGMKRPLSSPVTLPAKRHPLVPTLSENLPRFRSQDHLALGDKELEAVTMLHTLCNSQQTAKFVTKPRTANVARHTASPREAVKIQWKEELITGEEAVHTPTKSRDSPSRPILSERAPEQLFPYCDSPSSPVVIRRSGKKTNGAIAPARLAFF